VVCVSCGSDNSEGRGFCGQCGAALEVVCRACGAPNRPDHKFCGGCGRALVRQVPAAFAGPGHPEAIANGRYRVRRMLGEGASKIVYLAHDEVLDRDVAVSLFRVEGLDDAGRARILREARAMGRLGDHPNVVGIYDIGEAENGRPYIVSQYLPGGSLADLLRRSGGKLAPLDAVRIAEQLCLGIEHAHSLGIVHRDIKPANVFLANDGTPLLGDFGLAVAPDQSRVTAKGMMVGTAAYMPPEQALGHALEPRSDLYSLGAMLYEMLTGRPPFVGDDLVAIVSQHVNAAPQPPSAHAQAIDAALDALVLKLLAKSPAERPQSAAAVRETLHAIAGSSRGAMDQLASSVMVERPNLSSHAAPDGTVSLLFSDIENSTVIIERLGDLRAQEVFRTHNRAIREQIATHGGYEVKSMGDGFMIAFASARRALLCAVDIQRWLADYCAQHPEAPIRVRIGLHTGEAIRESGDFFGKTVVLAARIGAAAQGGEILVSSTFKAITESAGDIRYDAGRDMNLKGLAGSHRVHRVLWASEVKRCPKCAKPLPPNSGSCPHCEGKVVELDDGAATAAAKPAEPRWTLETAAGASRSTNTEAAKATSIDELSRLRRFIRPAASAPAGAIAAVVVAIVAIALIRWEFSSRPMASNPPEASNHQASRKTNPIASGPRTNAPTSLAAEERHAPNPKKTASALSSTRPPAASLPRSKTTIISSSTDSFTEEPGTEAGSSDAAAVKHCAPTPHRYNIEVDSVSDKTEADDMVKRISDLGFNACESTTTVNGEKRYAVRVGPYKTADEAAAAQEKLHEQYKDAYSDQ